jgi:basic membrane protein A
MRISVGLLAFLAVSACSDSELDSSRSDQAAETPSFYYIAPDPIGVNPFLIMGRTGIEEAAKIHGAKARVLESEDPTTREENLRAAVDAGASVIVVLGFEFNDAISRIAPRAPDVRFLIVDHCLENPPRNVFCGVFREFDAGFLVGAEAALLTKTGHVGSVGVMDIPFLRRYTDSFEAGARHVDPEIRVSTRWVGGEKPFSDPVRAKEQAVALASAGVDHMLAAAAAGNFGVFEAAREQGFRVFGIDINQCPSAPGHVVDNLMKRVDRVIIESIQAVLSGTTEQVLIYGLEEGGVDVVALDDSGSDSQCLIQDHPEVIERILELKDQIVRGEIGIEDPMGLL